MSEEIVKALDRIAAALERIAGQREAMMAEAADVEAEDRKDRGLAVGEVIDVVSAVCNCDILLKSRILHYVWARGAAMTVIREHLGLSLPAIGRAFDLDHTTVLHAINRFRHRETWSKFDHERWAEINKMIEKRIDNRQEEPTIAEPGSPEAFRALANFTT